jgi:hypothetical protein
MESLTGEKLNILAGEPDPNEVLYYKVFNKATKT